MGLRLDLERGRAVVSDRRAVGALLRDAGYRLCGPPDSLLTRQQATPCCW